MKMDIMRIKKFIKGGIDYVSKSNIPDSWVNLSYFLYHIHKDLTHLRVLESMIDCTFLILHHMNKS